MNPSASSARGRRSGTGGDLVHYQDANNLDEAETVFTVTAVLPPGADLLVPVSDEELAERAHLRAPRSN